MAALVATATVFVAHPFAINLTRGLFVSPFLEVCAYALSWNRRTNSPYWGWGRYERSTPWYRSVRIYRQQKMHDWASVFEKIRGDLADLAHEVARLARTNTTSLFV